MQLVPSSDPTAKIRLAVVGLNFGRWIVLDRQKPRGLAEYFELAAVCDLDPARAGEIAAQTGVRGCTDFDEILSDPSIAAVAIFTSPTGRATLIRRAIRAGKDVMTTKPLETDAEAAQEVLAEARTLGRLVHLNSPPAELAPELQRIEEWREQYRLGRPVGARAEVYASYREEADGTWYDDPDRCVVAPLFRLGIYVINDLVHLFGEAASVQVLKSSIFTGRPTPDNAQMGIRFKNGALANVFASFCIADGQPYANSLTLNYANGTIYRNVGRLAFESPGTPPTLRLVTQQNGQPVMVSSDEVGDSHGYRWDAFWRAIRGEPLFTPSHVAVEGLRIIAALARADRSGSVEAVR